MSSRVEINPGPTSRMANRYIKNGHDYFDTTWIFRGFASEIGMRKSLIRRQERDKFKIAGKMNIHNLIAAHKEELDVLEHQDFTFRKQLAYLDADYFDYYSIHYLDKQFYETALELGLFDFMRHKREDRLMRKIGIIWNGTPQDLDTVLTEQPDLDFVQLQINYIDWEAPLIQSRACYEVALRHGKEIIAMETTKSGTLDTMPKRENDLLLNVHPDWTPQEWALRFVTSLPGISYVLTCPTSTEDARIICKIKHLGEPLSFTERETLRQVAAISNSRPTINCTYCEYCITGNLCQQNLAVTDYFQLYNNYVASESRDTEEEMLEIYRSYIQLGYGRASECIACRHCDILCQQHIKLSDAIKTIAQIFDKPRKL